MTSTLVSLAKIFDWFVINIGSSLNLVLVSAFPVAGPLVFIVSCLKHDGITLKAYFTWIWPNMGLEIIDGCPDPGLRPEIGVINSGDLALK